MKMTVLIIIAVLISTPTWAREYLRCDLDKFQDRLTHKPLRFDRSGYNGPKSFTFIANLTNGLSLNEVMCNVSDDQAAQFYECENIKLGDEISNIKLDRFSTRIYGKIEKASYAKDDKAYTEFFGHCKFVKHLF